MMTGYARITENSGVDAMSLFGVPLQTGPGNVSISSNLRIVWVHSKRFVGWHSHVQQRRLSNFSGRPTADNRDTANGRSSYCSLAISALASW